MRSKLFEVGEVTYTVSGVLVLAGIVEKEARDESRESDDGDSIIIIFPDENEIKTKAKGGGIFKIQGKLVHSALIRDLKKEDIPIGSIVFVDEN